MKIVLEKRKNVAMRGDTYTIKNVEKNGMKIVLARGTSMTAGK